MKIFCSLLILLFFITQPFSQETTGNLGGWILGTDNKPLPDVNISVSSFSLPLLFVLGWKWVFDELYLILILDYGY